MKLLTFLLLILPFTTFAQDFIPKNPETGKYEYSLVVDADSVSAAKLYSNAKLFIVSAFVSGKDVTQLNDEASHTVAGTGTKQINFKGIGLSAVDKWLSFKMLIQCKDGRYKYTISDLLFEVIDGKDDRKYALEDEKKLLHDMLTKGQLSQLKQQANETIGSLIVQLQKHMAAKKDW